MNPDHLIHRFAYMKNDIPVAGCAHQAGTARFGTDPAHLRAEHRLPGARGRQPLRRRHQRLPVDRRREPGADGDGELAPRRRPPARAAVPERGAGAGRSPLAPSGEQIEIAFDEQRAVIVEVGGGLRSYSASGHDVLDGYGVDEMSTSGRGQVLIPWPNRLQDGSYEFDGRRHQLPLTEPTAQNAIHGLVRWAALERGAPRAEPRRAGARAPPAARLPVLAGTRLEYALSDGRARGADDRHQRRPRRLPVRERRPPVPDGRHGDGRPGRAARPGAHRARVRRAQPARRDEGPWKARTTTSAGRGRSARRSSTTRSPTSSGTRTAAPASSSTIPRAGERSRCGSDESYPYLHGLHRRPAARREPPQPRRRADDLPAERLPHG